MQPVVGDKIFTETARKIGAHERIVVIAHSKDPVVFVNEFNISRALGQVTSLMVWRMHRELAPCLRGRFIYFCFFKFEAEYVCLRLISTLTKCDLQAKMVMELAWRIGPREVAAQTGQPAQEVRLCPQIPAVSNERFGRY